MTVQTTRASSLADLRVDDAMHPGVYACPRNTPLRLVARMMATRRIHSVVVYDPSDERAGEDAPWGVVSDFDVLAAASLGAIDGRTAGDTATSPVVVTHPDASLRRAIRLMRQHGAAHAVVVERGSMHPVGVLSTLDVAALLADPHAGRQGAAGTLGRFDETGTQLAYRRPHRRLAGVTSLPEATERRISMSATRLMQDLAREQFGFELVRHPRTETAGQEAMVLGLDLDEVGKTLVVATGEGFVRVVLPASCRLDMRKVRSIVDGGKEVRLASEAELAGAYPMFELGAVPPIGGTSDRVIVDERIAAQDWVVVEAGTHEESLRFKASDLVRLANAEIGDVCRDE